MANPIPTWPRDRFPVDLNRTQWSMPESFLNGLTALPGYLEVTTLVGDQNNLEPPDFAERNLISLSSTTDINITGIVASQQGELKFILNRGPHNITLVNESGLSDAPNRFSGATSITLAPNEGMMIVQDSVSNRWRFLSNGSISLVGRIPYPTLTAALANVPLGATFFNTAAYAETGDGGQGFYYAIETPISPAVGQYQAASGEWFEIGDPILYAEQFGAKGHATDGPNAQAITAIVNGTPGIVTIPNHGLVDGDIVWIDGCLNTFGNEEAGINECHYVVTNATTNTFELYGFAGNPINPLIIFTYAAGSGTAYQAYNDTQALVDCKNCAQRLNRAQYWVSKYIIDPGQWAWIGDVSDVEHKPGPIIFTGADVTFYPTNTSDFAPVFSIAKSASNVFRFVRGGEVGPFSVIDNNEYTYTTFNLFNISNSDPAIVTTTEILHNFVDGDVVYIKGAGGMTQINEQFYIVRAPITDSTLRLEDMSNRSVDSRGYGIYTSGGTITLVPRRHALSVSGIQDMSFGKIFGHNLKGNLLHIDNRHINFNSDYFHVASCVFGGLTATQDTTTMVPTYCFDNDLIDQGCSSNIINQIFGSSVAAWRGAGAANTVLNVATGSFGPGWALSFTPIGQTFRCYFDSAEFDSPEYGMRIQEVAGLFARAPRINVRAGGTANYPYIPAGFAWPRISISLGSSATGMSEISQVDNSQIGTHFRVQVPINVLPILLDLNNDPNLTNITLNLSSGVDAFFFEISTITNNGSGAYRLTSVVAGDARDFATGQIVQVNNVTGTPAAALNGNWFTITVIDNQSIDLQNTTYTGDGTGGDLTSIYSLYSPVQSGITISGMANNGANLIRVTVNNTDNLVDGQLIRIANATGINNVNCVWAIIKVSSTTFDLRGSVFNGAYSGGAIITHPWIANINPLATIRITMDGRVIYDTLKDNSALAVGMRFPITNVAAGGTGGTEILLTVVTTVPMATGMRVTVEGLTGSPLGNAEWVITVRSATTFSLNGSTFVANGQAAGAFVANFVNVAAQYLLEPSRMYFAGEISDSSAIYHPALGEMLVPYNSSTRLSATLTIPAYFGMQVRMAFVRNRLGTFVPLAESNQRGIGDGSAVRTITGITNANPAVVTTGAAHNITSGTIVYITGVTTMTAVNGRFWIAANASGSTFDLQTLAAVNFDASALGAGTGGFAAVCMDQTFSITTVSAGLELRMGDMVWLSAVTNAGDPVPIRNSSPYSGASGGSADKTNRLAFMVSQQ